MSYPYTTKKRGKQTLYSRILLSALLKLFIFTETVDSFYFVCVSTVFILLRESGWKLPFKGSGNNGQRDNGVPSMVFNHFLLGGSIIKKSVTGGGAILEIGELKKMPSCISS